MINSLLLSGSAGMADNFNGGQNYSWTIATASGSVNGFVADKFSLDTSGFANPFTGDFGIELINSDINLTYTGSSTPAVPEPTSLALLAMGSVGLVGYRARNRKRKPLEIEPAE